MSNIEEKTEKLLTKKINDLGYELYDVIFAKEGKDFYLKIFIDKPEGIDINDCEKVNNEINPMLDEANYIEKQYFLEVSSPGIERLLRKDKHLNANIGKKIELKFYTNFNNQGSMQGILKGFDKENIIIETEGEEIIISKKNISSIKTVYEW